MEDMDATVIATSLPAIAVDFHRDPIVLKLALTSYMLTLAAFIPASGWVADRFGARAVFCCAIVVFTFGSLLCGFAQSLWQLIGARVVQGLGGAMMMPVGRLVLLRSLPKSEMVNGLSYMTVPALVGPMIGPPLGGFITTYFHWRWIFWINMPIGLLGIVLTLRFIPNIRSPKVARFDVWGFWLSGLGLLSTVAGFSVIGRHIAPEPVVVALIFGGLVCLAFYVRYARQCPSPILDLRFLKVPTFLAGAIGGLMFRVGIGAIPFLLPLLLQIGFGLSPFEAGCLIFSSSIGAIGMKFINPHILKRFGFRVTLIANGLCNAACLASFALVSQQASHTMLLLWFLMGGAFRSLQYTALNAVSYADISTARMGSATSFYSVFQQLSQAVGVAIAAMSVQYWQWQFHDMTLQARDMQASFLVVGLISLGSVPFFLRLKPEAGAEVSGHRQYAC